MTVSLPSFLPPPMPTERAKPDQQKVEQPTRDRQPFRALLEPEGAGLEGTGSGRLEQPVTYPVSAALEGSIAVEAGGQHFSLSLSPKDRAIAFEARPIVGPAFVENGQLPASDVLPTSEAGALQASPAVLPNGVPGQALASGVRAGIDAQAGTGTVRNARSGALPHGPRSGMPAADLMLRPGGSHSPAWTNDAPVAAARTHDALLSGRTTAAAGVLPTTLELARRAQVFAQLLASTDEYHVVVRGVQASRPEQRELASAIKAALRAYGLPDRPVVISMSEAEG